MWVGADFQSDRQRGESKIDTTKVTPSLFASCHPERSEGPVHRDSITQILRFAQDDKVFSEGWQPSKNMTRLQLWPVGEFSHSQSAKAACP
jgi:hypothetical protein